jgi:DNA helicase II / ATP-dependent DNA helicase PcrA
MESAAFQRAYSELNAAQKRAVDAIEGPVMVIAGPGTGKTQLLTLRIANILLKTDTQPENILALTFTESGARAMRERLRVFIGARAYQIPIHTFHGFADMLIRTYPDAFPRIIGGRAASDLDKVRVVAAILENPDVKKLRPMGDSSYYINPILRTLSMLKQEYIGPNELSAIIRSQEESLSVLPRYHEKGAHKGKERGEYKKKAERIEKNKELLFVYHRYESMLATERLYDLTT